MHGRCSPSSPPYIHSIPLALDLSVCHAWYTLNHHHPYHMHHNIFAYRSPHLVCHNCL